MRYSSALRLLGETHAAVLLLVDGGLSNDEIAARLDLEPTAVGPLVHVARAKLAALLAVEDAAQ